MSACHDTMITRSSTLVLDTDSDTAINKLEESVSLTRMAGRREGLFLPEDSLAVIVEQSLVPRLVCSSCGWRFGNIVCCVV